MNTPEFHITPAGIGAYAEMFEINIEGMDPEELTAHIRAGLEGLAYLRNLDVTGVEPFATFPIDRVQK